jgi:hypothetical protein
MLLQCCCTGNLSPAAQAAQGLPLTPARPLGISPHAW